MCNVHLIMSLITMSITVYLNLSRGGASHAYAYGSSRLSLAAALGP